MPEASRSKAQTADAHARRALSSGAMQAGRLAATFSVVAHDPLSGTLGIAVASHSFAVGSRVPWAEPGTGAVATQAFVAAGEPGSRALALLREHRDAARVLEQLLAADPAPELRQIAIVDPDGRVAVHTGARCIGAASHRARDGFCVQGNTLPAEAVLDAMAVAYEASRGDLAERLLGVLAAGESVGGDLRGRRSAALLVVPGSKGAAGGTRLVDLRVDDHVDPHEELARLLRIRRAGERFEAAFQAIARDEFDAARAHFADAQKRHPENAEYSFWAGVSLANAGYVEEGIVWLRTAFAAHPCWRELIARLPSAGLLAEDARLSEWIRHGAR
jgi:uncharacterized Ntn-hydrolase superfamily protein